MSLQIQLTAPNCLPPFQTDSNGREMRYCNSVCAILPWQHRCVEYHASLDLMHPKSIYTSALWYGTNTSPQCTSHHTVLQHRQHTCLIRAHLPQGGFDIQEHVDEPILPIPSSLLAHAQHIHHSMAYMVAQLCQPEQYKRSSSPSK